MAAENILKCLDKVRKTGRNKWQACCPAHDDKGPSLAVRELDDGRVLIHCFAGCGAVEILDAVGLDWSALHPTKAAGDHLPKVRNPWNASDVFTALSLEILIAWNCAKRTANGETLTENEQKRLLLCATRMQRGLEAIHG